MKRNLSFFIGVILIAVLAIQFVSCSTKEQDEIGFDNSVSEKTLQKYANIHNLGLEYIKSDMEKTSGTYTPNRLDSVFQEFVICKYGKDEGSEILREISPMKEQVFNGTIPTLQQTRSGEIEGFTDQTNAFALEALNECMDKIANHLNNVHEDELFDNTSLLDDLHAIVNETYTIYASKCISDIDADALTQTLGVLYGSIGYWTNSNNVKSWSKINMEENNGISLGTTSAFNKVIKKEDKKKKKKDDKKKDKEKQEEKKQDDRTLTISQWIQTVAGADAIGAALGAGVASSPAAIASSAAAAIYFNVK